MIDIFVFYKNMSYILWFKLAEKRKEKAMEMVAVKKMQATAALVPFSHPFRL